MEMRGQIAYLFGIVLVFSTFLVWSYIKADALSSIRAFSDTVLPILRQRNEITDGISMEYSKLVYATETSKYMPDPIWTAISSNKYREMPDNLYYLVLATRVREKMGTDSCVSAGPGIIRAGNITFSYSNLSESLDLVYGIDSSQMSNISRSYEKMKSMLERMLRSAFPDIASSLCSIDTGENPEACSEAWYYKYMLDVVERLDDSMFAGSKNRDGTIECGIYLKNLSFGLDQTCEKQPYCEPTYVWRQADTSGACEKQEAVRTTEARIVFTPKVSHECQMIRRVRYAYTLEFRCKDWGTLVYDEKSGKMVPFTLAVEVNNEVVNAGNCVEENLVGEELAGARFDSEACNYICECKATYGYCVDSEHPNGLCTTTKPCSSCEFNGRSVNGVTCYVKGCGNIPRMSQPPQGGRC